LNEVLGRLVGAEHSAGLAEQRSAMVVNDDGKGVGVVAQVGLDQ
jgi:hypothetical protein